jgi:phosphatidylglycerophosphatase C
MAEGSRRSVVFDLDGVLANGDSMSSLVRRRLFSNPFRLALAAPLVAAMSAFKGRPVPRGLMARSVVRVALLGVDPAEYAVTAHSTGIALAETPGWPIRAGIDAVRAHLAAGDRVTVTTGCEEHLARGFLMGVGLGEVPLVGSRFRPRDLPGTMYAHNYGAAKLSGLRSLGVPVERSMFYTDSIADLPVAAMAESVRLVNPDEGIRQAYFLAGVSFDHVRWDLGTHQVKSYNV